MDAAYLYLCVLCAVNASGIQKYSTEPLKYERIGISHCGYVGAGSEHRPSIDYHCSQLTISSFQVQCCSWYSLVLSFPFCILRFDCDMSNVSFIFFNSRSETLKHRLWWCFLSLLNQGFSSGSSCFKDCVIQAFASPKFVFI